MRTTSLEWQCEIRLNLVESNPFQRDDFLLGRGSNALLWFMPAPLDGAMPRSSWACRLLHRPEPEPAVRLGRELVTFVVARPKLSGNFSGSIFSIFASRSKFWGNLAVAVSWLASGGLEGEDSVLRLAVRIFFQ